MSTVNRNVLTTTESVSHAPLLFDSEGTTFVVDNAAKTSLFNDSSLLIGPIIYPTVTLDTANGNRGLVLNTGPIRIYLEDDSGKALACEFQDVVYNPYSPFNIMSVGRVG